MKNDNPISDLAQILQSVMQEMNITSKTGNTRLPEFWRTAVGERIAKVSHPETVRNGILFVNVANSVWMQELHFLRDKILEKLNSQMDKKQLREIRFRIGPLPGSTRAKPAGPLPPLDKTEMEKIERESASIHDSELRSSFQEFMAAYFKNKKNS